MGTRQYSKCVVELNEGGALSAWCALLQYVGAVAGAVVLRLVAYKHLRFLGCTFCLAVVIYYVAF